MSRAVSRAAGTAAELPVTSRWSFSTVYDKLTPDLRAKLAVLPPMQWTSVQIQAHAIGAGAVSALLRGFREGQANADAAAAAVISPSLDSHLRILFSQAFSKTFITRSLIPWIYNPAI
jgi:hypothetical protein